MELLEHLLVSDDQLQPELGAEFRVRERSEIERGDVGLVGLDLLCDERPDEACRLVGEVSSTVDEDLIRDAVTMLQCRQNQVLCGVRRGCDPVGATTLHLGTFLWGTSVQPPPDQVKQLHENAFQRESGDGDLGTFISFH